MGEFRSHVCCVCGRDPVAAGLVMGDPGLCDYCLAANWSAIVCLVKAAPKVTIAAGGAGCDTPPRVGGLPS